MDLVGIVVPGERPLAVPGRKVTFVGGCHQPEDGTELIEKAEETLPKLHFLHRNASLFASDTGHG
jgi:hypothetical protein